MQNDPALPFGLGHNSPCPHHVGVGSFQYVFSSVYISINGVILWSKCRCLTKIGFEATNIAEFLSPKSTPRTPLRVIGSLLNLD